MEDADEVLVLSKKLSSKLYPRRVSLSSCCSSLNGLTVKEITSFSKNESVLVIFSLCSDWFLGNSVVCFGVGMISWICCVLLMQ